MTSPHPLGVLLALVFLTAMGLTFWWMFRVPPPLPREAARAYHSVAAIRKILVPVLGTLVSERAVELAARVGERQRAEIILAYVVHIPWTLPLNARLLSKRSGHKTPSRLPSCWPNAITYQSALISYATVCL